MQTGPNLQLLVEMDIRIAVLGLGDYALPVRIRTGDRVVDCLVPTWSGVVDLLADPAEGTLVALARPAESLRWVFVRGRATVVPRPQWEGWFAPHSSRIEFADLYHVVRIEPRRIEQIDERRGWGYRETADLG